MPDADQVGRFVSEVLGSRSAIFSVYDPATYPLGEAHASTPSPADVEEAVNLAWTLASEGIARFVASNLLAAFDPLAQVRSDDAFAEDVLPNALSSATERALSRYGGINEQLGVERWPAANLGFSGPQSGLDRIYSPRELLLDADFCSHLTDFQSRRLGDWVAVPNRPYNPIVGAPPDGSSGWDMVFRPRSSSETSPIWSAIDFLVSPSGRPSSYACPPNWYVMAYPAEFVLPKEYTCLIVDVVDAWFPFLGIPPETPSPGTVEALDLEADLYSYTKDDLRALSGNLLDIAARLAAGTTNTAESDAALRGTIGQLREMVGEARLAALLLSGGMTGLPGGLARKTTKSGVIVTILVLAVVWSFRSQSREVLSILADVENLSIERRQLAAAEVFETFGQWLAFAALPEATVTDLLSYALYGYASALLRVPEAALPGDNEATLAARRHLLAKLEESALFGLTFEQVGQLSATLNTTPPPASVVANYAVRFPRVFARMGSANSYEISEYVASGCLGTDAIYPLWGAQNTLDALLPFQIWASVGSSGQNDLQPVYIVDWVGGFGGFIRDYTSDYLAEVSYARPEESTSSDLRYEAGLAPVYQLGPYLRRAGPSASYGHAIQAAGQLLSAAFDGESLWGMLSRSLGGRGSVPQLIDDSIYGTFGWVAFREVMGGCTLGQLIAGVWRVLLADVFVAYFGPVAGERCLKEVLCVYGRQGRNPVWLGGSTAAGTERILDRVLGPVVFDQGDWEAFFAAPNWERPAWRNFDGSILGRMAREQSLDDAVAMLRDAQDAADSPGIDPASGECTLLDDLKAFIRLCCDDKCDAFGQLERWAVTSSDSPGTGLPWEVVRPPRVEQPVDPETWYGDLGAQYLGPYWSSVPLHWRGLDPNITGPGPYFPEVPSWLGWLPSADATQRTGVADLFTPLYVIAVLEFSPGGG